jgi:hypothetical protein
MRVEPFVPATVGAYLATVTVPTAGFLTLAAGGALPETVTLAGAWLAVAVVGSLVATGVSDLADTVGTVGVGGAAALLPLIFLPTMLSAPAASPPAILAAIGVASSGVGSLAATLGWTVQNRRRRADATEWHSVTAGDGDGLPKWLGVSAVLVPTALAAVVAVALGELDGDLPTSLLTALGSLGTIGSLIGDDETTITVTDDGVGIDGWFRGVETITGYDLDEEELELHRSGIVRTLSVDCAELDTGERASLRAALDRLLDDGTGQTTLGEGWTGDGGSARRDDTVAHDGSEPPDDTGGERPRDGTRTFDRER